MPSLTHEQTQALETRDVSVALAAGAGCGKTFVLTERFLSHLNKVHAPEGLELAKLSELIAITFTDAAAREMRARIREKCRQRLHDAPDENQAYWLELLRSIETARVSTIHAFCASLLRSHAVPLGLDPAFGMLDQGEATVLQSDIVDDVLREKLADHDETTLELATSFGLGTLKTQLVSLMDCRHEASFERWLRATPDEVVVAWREAYDRDAFRIASNEIASTAPIYEILELLRDVSPRNPRFAEARASLMTLLPLLGSGAITPAELEIVRSQAQVRGICNAKDWDRPERYEAYKNACSNLRDAIKSKTPPPFDPIAAREVACLGLDLLNLADHAIRRYEDRKSALGLLDFDDLLAHAHRLVTHADFAAIQSQLWSNLQLLMVDEFQDTNQLQVEIVTALCRGGLKTGRLFVVGDDKQSIYRFRGAVPQVFQDLQQEVGERGNLPLSTNFRSQPAILHFVNALFADAFDNYQPLSPHRAQVTSEPAIEFLWSLTPNKGARVKGAANEARREEARRIAQRLRQMLDRAEPIVVDRDTGKPRPARLGDIAILFRALTDVQVYEEALRDFGLEYYLVGGHAFYAQQEIHDVLNLLRAVASEADEISLAGALRSPFFSLADETLFWLVESSGSLNSALLTMSLPPQLSPEERAKANAATDTLAFLRANKHALSISELMTEALARTAYDATLLGEFLGERKLANLRKLVEQARAADQTGTIELDGFIALLTQVVADQPKEGLAATAPETADVIRLMTIHHSKGLEYPIVVIPDLDRTATPRSSSATLDANLGPLVQLPNDRQREKEEYATGMTLFNGIESSAERRERLRLLYVATTRAADYLILSSSLKAYDEPSSDWMKRIAARFDLETAQFRATPIADELPLVRATTVLPDSDFKPVGSSRRPNVAQIVENTLAAAALGQSKMPREVAPIEVDHSARTQFSFSRISGQLKRVNRLAEPDSDLARRDPFGDEAPWSFQRAAKASKIAIDPLALGSLVHDVLENLDFTADRRAQLNFVRKRCEMLAPEFALSNVATTASEGIRIISKFLETPRAQALASAPIIEREIEFLLDWPPIIPQPNPSAVTRFPEPSTGASSRYLQGFIDCLYQDPNNEWHLLDYKTNDISPSEVPRAAGEYEMQMYVYAMAIERSLGTSPSELVLHFLRPGVEHSFTWNDAARELALTKVNAAIAALTSAGAEASKSETEA